MFAGRTRVRRARVTQSIASCLNLQLRRAASTLRPDLVQTETPLAEQLSATGLWHYGRSKKALPSSKRPKADKARVNIVGDKLCDDILNYIRPTLDRHVGCDIIDLYPGAGLWSRKLHDVLQPRSHILLEPDAQFYAPYLEPLTSRPNVTLLPKSGIIWSELNQVLTKEYLPHQTEHPRSETPRRNDTLLVTANLSFYPKKKYHSFSNVSQLVLYQFITSIRAQSLFQKYGLVRMLLWTTDDEKSSLMPRSIQRRTRFSIEAELNTEYIAEVAGSDGTSVAGTLAANFFRDRAIDLESTRDVLSRMKAARISIPPGRETQIVRDLRAMSPQRRNAIRAGAKPGTFLRPFRAELDELEAAFTSGKYSAADAAQADRLKDLRYQAGWEEKRQKRIHDLLTDKSLTPAELDAEMQGLNKYLRIEAFLARDNRHVFRQDPRVLTWDRRPVEPLVARPAEFFPSVPCALLDVQPKAVHPLLRENGPGSGRGGDTFTMLLSSLMRSSVGPLSKALESIYPGAAEGVMPNCPSLRVDGGRAPGYLELTPRVLNERQIIEILRAWMEWPFRPEFSALVARESDDSGFGDDEGGSSVQMGDA